MAPGLGAQPVSHGDARILGASRPEGGGEGGEEEAFPREGAPALAVERGDVREAREVQGARDLMLENGFHAAHVLDHHVNYEIRTDGLKAPGDEGRGVEVAASVTAEASGP